MSKLYTIVNKSDVYILNKVREVYTDWGYTYEQMLTYTEWQDGLSSQASLFLPYFVKFDLTNEKNRTVFRDLVKKKKFADNWFGNGVIIVCNSAPGKWLKEFTEKYGGTYDEEVTIDSLLETINLSKENKDFVKYYVGDSTEDLLIIRNTLANIENTENLTVEELYSYLPNKMGSVPPWELINAIMKGNLAVVEQEFQRVIVNTHPLVLIKLLKNKFSDFMTYRMLSSAKVKESDICDILGYKNAYRLIDFKRSRCKHVDSIMNLIYTYEFKLKEGSSFLPNEKDLVHALIVKITLMMK